MSDDGPQIVCCGCGQTGVVRLAPPLCAKCSDCLAYLEAARALAHAPVLVRLAPEWRQA
jgi:hypothetical protein